MKRDGKIAILVVDDHFTVRMGLIALINTELDMVIVGEAADGDQAVDLYGKYKPDLVLMDVRMPIKNGIEATIEIRGQDPNARVLMLTAFGWDTDIHKALQAGVQGMVLKRGIGQELIPAIRAVAAGQRWIPKEIAERLVFRNSLNNGTLTKILNLN
jgi:DNA-binding NarL/FixJ family response regulator